MFPLKGTDGLDKGDTLSLLSVMDVFSPDRWPAIAAAARAIGASDWSVRKWRTRREIPGRWHLSLLRECAKRRVLLSSNELLSTQSQRAA